MDTRSPVAAVAFDLDGVLVDSESQWDAARRAIVARSGGQWREGATTEMMGMSSSEWSSFLHDQLGVPLQPSEINRLVVEDLLDRYRRELPLLPGAVDAVKRLAERWPLGLASSSNRPVIDLVLEQADITESFAATVSGDEVARGKPAPDVYLAVMDRLGVEPPAGAAVEDSSNGLRAAAAAGLHVIAVPNREYPPAADALALAELEISSLDALTVAAIDALG
jgi:HAD superfamily hydrolase (TIGR01509 family)